jgi:hypothetical protein
MAFRRFTNSWHWHSDIPTFLTCRKVRRRTVSRIKLKDIQQKQSKETKDTPSVPGMPLLKGSKIVTKRSTHQQSYTVIHWISMNIPAYSLIQYNMTSTWYRSMTRPCSLMSKNPNGPKARPSVDAVLPARPHPTPTALWSLSSGSMASIVSSYSRLSKHVIDLIHNEMQVTLQVRNKNIDTVRFLNRTQVLKIRVG